MARLTDNAGHLLELKPLRYESPWEGWLVVRLEVSNGATSWSAEASTLLHGELTHLIRWLGQIADDATPLPARWEGIEPSIAFDAMRSDGQLLVRVRLNFVFLPPERRDGTYWEGQDEVVDFTPSRDELLGFAEELGEELRSVWLRPPGT